MPIDPTIPLQIQPQQSPLQGIQAPIQAAQGLLALRQNQMQLGANQAISQAYSQAVNPDGSVDFNKLQSLAAQSGAGAYLPQFMGQLATQRNQQQQYDVSKLDMALKQQQSIRGMIGSLAMDPSIGKEDMSQKIAGQISDAVQSGILPLDQGVREIQSIPSDPAAQATWIQNHLINSLSGEAKIQALMPKQLTINRGGETDVLNVDPMTGRLSVTGALANSLTPAEAAQRVPTVLPNGQPGTVPLGSTVGQAGGAAPGAYTGRYNPQPSAASGVPGAPSGFLPTGLSPAEQAGQSAAGTGAANAAQAMVSASSDSPMRINLLDQARQMLAGGTDQNGDPLNTGPGSDWRNTAKSFINSLSPATAKALGWTGDIKHYDEFKKILTNYASSVSGSLGTGTDARLNAAVTGNANPNISNMANDDILVKTIAAEKMRQAQAYAWSNARDAQGNYLSQTSPQQFNTWQTQWNHAVDPQAFAYAEMNPQQRADFQKRMSPTQLSGFRNTFNSLVGQGIITLPNAAAPASAPAPAAPLPPSGVPR